MTITITGKTVGADTEANYILCTGGDRNDTGLPVGPEQMTSHLSPGDLERAYIGDQGITAEAVGGDRKALAFRVTRIYKTLNEALKGYLDVFTCPREGAIRFGATPFMNKATLKNLTADISGVCVTIDYEFAGW